MSQIVVREAALNDCEAVQRLNCKEMGYDYPLESTGKRMRFILADSGHKIYVAEQDGMVVGYIHGCDYDLLYSDHLKNIMGVAVSQDSRRQGIGRLLLNAVEKWARDTGAAGVRLVSGAGRTGAHAFYTACGYQNKKDQINFIKAF